MPVLQSELKAFAACLRQERSPATINSMLSAVNHLLKFLDREDCKIKFLRVQRKAFRDQNRELTRNEYTPYFHATLSPRRCYNGNATNC